MSCYSVMPIDYGRCERMMLESHKKGRDVERNFFLHLLEHRGISCEVIGYTNTGRKVMSYPFVNMCRRRRSVIGGIEMLRIDFCEFEWSCLQMFCSRLGISLGDCEGLSKSERYRRLYGGVLRGCEGFYRYVSSCGGSWVWNEVVGRGFKTYGNRVHTLVQGTASWVFSKYLEMLGVSIYYEQHDEVLCDVGVDVEGALLRLNAYCGWSFRLRKNVLRYYGDI